MSSYVINLITPPDKLFNNNTSILLVNPSDYLKEDINTCLKNIKQDLNLYLYEESDITWLLDVINSVDYILLDINNVQDNHWVIGYILSKQNCFYLTNDQELSYNNINRNRVYDAKQFLEGVEVEAG
jgi:hypothetical protein